MKATDFIIETLDDKSINALLKAKEILAQRQAEELEAWKADMAKKFPQLTQKPVVNKPQSTFQPQDIEPEYEPEDEPLPFLQEKIKGVNSAIEKLKLLEKLKLKAEHKGLLTQAMDSDTDVSLYVPYAYKDSYRSLNDKLDKSIQIIQQRLKLNRIAFKEAEIDEADIEEGWKDVAAAGAVALGMMGAPSAAKASINTQPQAQTQQIKFNALGNNPQLENLLARTAMQAGMKGVELAQFMAQCAHESWDFTKLKEKGGSLDFRKYDPKFNPQKAKRLGNTQVGDGQKFHGRGFIQLTGRENYRRAGQALNLPLEEKPELAERPDVAAQIAVWYWNSRVKPYVNNFTDTTAVTKRINAGLKGLQDRQENFKDYLQNV